MRYLLDTNICIYVIKRKPSRVFERFRAHKVGDVGISIVTYCELEYGVANSSDEDRNRAALHEFLAPLEIVEMSANVGPIYGRLRASLTKAGKPIGPLDTFIAAHAVAIGAVLVTNNVKEFARIPLVKLENWA